MLAVSLSAFDTELPSAGFSLRHESTIDALATRTTRPSMPGRTSELSSPQPDSFGFVSRVRTCEQADPLIRLLPAQPAGKAANATAAVSNAVATWSAIHVRFAGPVTSLTAIVPFADDLGGDIVIHRMAALAKRADRVVEIVGRVQRAPGGAHLGRGLGIVNHRPLRRPEQQST
jgi:hypothetical protein